MFSPYLYQPERKKMRAVIVDDEPTIRLALLHFLRSRGYEVEEAATGESAVIIARRFLPDIVFLDSQLPDCNGEELLNMLTSPEIGASVIMMTAYAELDKAVSAMKNGADYYFPKPLDLEHVAVILDKLEKKIGLAHEVEYFRRMSEKRDIGGCLMLGDCPQIIKIKRLTTLLARNAATPVLILGESGSGKEVVAKSIHTLSEAKGQMVEVNCASLSEHLFESELFGHEKGAFTDARDLKKGLFELADGGTIFFDELAEMPLSIQAKLLKVLDSKCFRRVGGLVDIRSSARFMAATNRDIQAMVKAGQFREDLFYRISVFPVHVPPLRERGRDILMLAGFFAARIGEEMGKAKASVSPEAMTIMQNYGWPGNVRELKNVIERALILSEEGMILPQHLSLEMRGAAAGPAQSSAFAELRSLHRIKKDYIKYVLTVTAHNHSRTASILGISRSTLLAGLKEMD